MPDLAWCGDITYILTDEGWLYLASVLDLGRRRLIGWSMEDQMPTALVAAALDNAVAQRGGRVAGVIFHSSSIYRQIPWALRRLRHPSVGRTGGNLLRQLGGRVVLVEPQA